MQLLLLLLLLLLLSPEWICSDGCMMCHIEMKDADLTCCLHLSHTTDTGLTSPTTDLTMPGGKQVKPAFPKARRLTGQPSSHRICAWRTADSGIDPLLPRSGCACGLKTGTLLDTLPCKVPGFMRLAALLGAWFYEAGYSARCLVLWGWLLC